MRNQVFRDGCKSLVSAAAVGCRDDRRSGVRAEGRREGSHDSGSEDRVEACSRRCRTCCSGCRSLPPLRAAAAAPRLPPPHRLPLAPLVSRRRRLTLRSKSAWVKLCEKAPLVKKDKDGKDVKEEKNLCLTHHERLDGNTGMVLVSAAIRQIEGQEKQSLMIMVPLGMAIPPGVRAADLHQGAVGRCSEERKDRRKDFEADRTQVLAVPPGRLHG